MKVASFILLLAWCIGASAPAASLTVVIEHTFRGEPLRTEEMSLAAPDGKPMSITRLAYLVTELALLQEDGRALRCNQQAAYLNPTTGHVEFTVPDVPEGRYAGVAFRVGVPAEWNHRDPSAWPAAHALNPALNGLHWGWQGGFVFLALEGKIGPQGAFIYHLAGDENLSTVRLENPWEFRGESALRVRFDTAKLLDGLNPGADGADGSTHSSANDPVASRLRSNISRAFSFLSVDTLTEKHEVVRESATIVPHTTPFSLRIPAGYPQPQLPADNPLTVEGVALGERLFHETRLSVNSTQSCGSCHRPAFAFSDTSPVSTGAEGKPGTRNAPPLFNLAWPTNFGWDGRRARLREQALAPFTDAREFHFPVSDAAERIATDYRAAFARAFGAPEVTGERIGLALEQFLLTQIAGGQAKFDQVARGEAAFTPDEQRGFELFHMEHDPARGRLGADCFHCHGGTLFSDYALHNTGLDPQTAAADRGREAVTGRASDRGKFKTSSLRNLSLTAPYMHDGRFHTLEEVIAQYDHGIQQNPSLDPSLAKHLAAGLGLSSSDQHALIAFLRTLDDLPTPSLARTP